MMTINGTGNVGQGQQMSSSPVAAKDSVSKNIEKQIANAQQRLQGLSTNEELSVEEKMKKRQEIQKQISELNNRLRQHQVELRKEQNQSRAKTMEEMVGGEQNGAKEEDAEKEGLKDIALSSGNVKTIISAGSSIKQAQISGSVAAQLGRETKVLESEIEQDASRGSSTVKKEEKLAALEKQEQTAVKSQASYVGKVNSRIAEERKEELKKDRQAEQNKQSDETVHKVQINEKKTLGYLSVDFKI